jgi:hypothetical protein
MDGAAGFSLLDAPAHGSSPSKGDEGLEALADVEIMEYPLLPLRGTVVFPQMLAPLVVGRDRSGKAVEAAAANDDLLLVVAQRDEEIHDPGVNDVYAACRSSMWCTPNPTFACGHCPSSSPA